MKKVYLNLFVAMLFIAFDSHAAAGGSASASEEFNYYPSTLEETAANLRRIVAQEIYFEKETTPEREERYRAAIEAGDSSATMFTAEETKDYVVSNEFVRFNVVGINSIKDEFTPLLNTLLPEITTPSQRVHNRIELMKSAGLTSLKDVKECIDLVKIVVHGKTTPQITAGDIVLELCKTPAEDRLWLSNVLVDFVRPVDSGLYVAVYMRAFKKLGKEKSFEVSGQVLMKAPDEEDHMKRMDLLCGIAHKLESASADDVGEDGTHKA